MSTACRHRLSSEFAWEEHEPRARTVPVEAI